MSSLEDKLTATFVVSLAAVNLLPAGSLDSAVTDISTLNTAWLSSLRNIRWSLFHACIISFGLAPHKTPNQHHVMQWKLSGHALSTKPAHAQHRHTELDCSIMTVSQLSSPL